MSNISEKIFCEVKYLTKYVCEIWVCYEHWHENFTFLGTLEGSISAVHNHVTLEVLGPHECLPTILYWARPLPLAGVFANMALQLTGCRKRPTAALESKSYNTATCI